MAYSFKQRVEELSKSALQTVIASSQTVASQVEATVTERFGSREELVGRVRVAQEQLHGLSLVARDKAASALEDAETRLSSLHVPPAAQGAVHTVASALHGARQAIAAPTDHA